jgi:hypothetical protein
MAIYERKSSIYEVGNSDGEVVDRVVNKVYLVKGAGKYVVQYDYRFLYDLSGISSGLLCWLAFEAKFNTNLVILDEKYAEDNLGRLRIGNIRRFKKLMRDLERCNLIFKRGQWSWIINPTIFFRGSQKSRGDLIKELLESGNELKYDNK